MKRCFLFFLIITLNFVNAQINFSGDENDNLILIQNKKNNSSDITVISDCFSNNDFIESIKAIKKSEKSIVIIGTYEYTYYVDNYETYAGLISHDFIITIDNQNIEYKFMNFVHKKDNSNFNSLGRLSFNYNEKTNKIFTKKNYEEIISDLRINLVNHIRMISKNCS